MKKQSSIFTLMLLAVSTAIGVIIILTVSTHTGSIGAYTYGTTNLVGASPEQVGEFAQEYAEAQHGTANGNFQVLLTRSIKPDELPTLELGCPLSFAAIEEPPLMLVVLKGEFTPSGPGASGIGLQANYLAYIFDLWSAKPVYLKASKTGGHFRKVLNSNTLPLETQDIPAVCPTNAPFQKTLHYGDTVPGLIPPTIVPNETASAPPVPSIPIPNATSGSK